MTYQDNVKEAASALSTGEDANWELARLTHENTRQHGGRGEQSGRVTMEQWCSDVRGTSGRRFSKDTGKLYRAIWTKFEGVDLSSRPGWTEAMIEVKPSSAAEPMRERVTDAHLREATPERKREIFQRLSQDEDVLEEKEHVLTTLLSDPLIQQKIKHNPSAIPGVEDAVVDIASNSPRTAARVNVQYEEKHPASESKELAVTPYSSLGLFGTAASSVIRARQGMEDVEKLLDWIERSELDVLDLDAIRAEIDHWQRAAQLCLGYANQLAIAIGDETQEVESPVERMSSEEIDSWIDSVLKGIS